MGVALVNPKVQFLSQTGAPLANGTVTVYVAGSTTPTNTWQDEGLTALNTNPITLDSRGECLIWTDPAVTYKFVLKNAGGVTQWTVDNIKGAEPSNLRALLAASSGSAMVGFIQSGTGAVARTMQDKTREVVSVKDFGAVGDGVTDDTVSIQNAVNAAMCIDFGNASTSYKVSAAIALRTGQVLVGNGATVTQVTANTEIFNTEAKSNVEIFGFNFVGKGNDYADSDSSRAAAIYGGTSGTNNHVHNNKFTNFTYTAARFAAQSQCSFVNNVVVGPGYPTLTAITSGKCYGVLFDTGCNGCLIAGNDISKCAQGAIVERATDVRIVANRFFSITGQHGVYAGAGLRNLVVHGNAIYDTDLCGIKVQAQDYAVADNVNIAITGNTIYNARDQGILVTNSTNLSTYKCRDVSVVGNTVRITGGQSIYVSQILHGVVSGNVCEGAGQGGIAWRESQDIVITDNVVASSANSAMRDYSPASAFVTLRDNVIRNCCTARTVNDDTGIRVEFAGSNYTIDGNVISDANANMRYGVYIIASINSTLALLRNAVRNATDYGLRLGSTAAMLEYRDNYWTGTLSATANDPALVAVASAASITLPTGSSVIAITGTTTITSISSLGHSGKRITLVFGGASQINRGGTLLLASNFLPTANSTITLVCDGNAWYECSRSTF